MLITDEGDRKTNEGNKSQTPHLESHMEKPVGFAYEEVFVDELTLP